MLHVSVFSRDEKLERGRREGSGEEGGKAMTEVRGSRRGEGSWSKHEGGKKKIRVSLRNKPSDFTHGKKTL